VLDGHPELAAKGFYMVKRIAFEPMQATFHLDEVSDKIVWAAKYPLYMPYRGDFFVDYEKMEPVPFSEKTVEYSLCKEEVLYIFCVKDAFEGAHSTHNCCKISKDINIMDARAVRRFIDLCYEPIVQAIPDAYSRAIGIFTDEPSLQTSYARPYSTWNWALAPWVDGLFEEYEKMWGESLLPNLPLIFEGTGDKYPPIRVKFYELVGALIARAFSGQLSEWCEAHGGIFSGHYLLEEQICQHVMQYGNYLRVLMAATYPGIDVLYGHPEAFEYTAMKYAQMAVRKKHTDGMMLEFCPLVRKEDFEKNYSDNTKVALSTLYMGGVRHTQTYFQPTDPVECTKINEYIGRVSVMLEGLHNDCDTFIYYPLEDVQAKERPRHAESWEWWDRNTASCADVRMRELVPAVFEGGHDFYMIDREDLAEAVRTLSECGVPTISGNRVKNVIVPGVHYIYREAMEMLGVLKEAGVRVFFSGAVPSLDVMTAQVIEHSYQFSSLEEILLALDAEDTYPIREADGSRALLRSKYLTEDGRVLYMLINRTRADVQAVFRGADAAELWNPEDGTQSALDAGDAFTVPAMRTLFVY
ncbi:MAG: hypothetical protein J6S41_06765, partial [Clostridia bacterium]|nr:hypothetical protein [Clostridia bacterium]